MREQHPRDCFPIRSVSVLMPTWQGMEFLERVLDSLSAQVTAIRWDFHVIDSGSTDGTVECLTKRAEDFPVPLHLYTIESAEFDHGDTRNQLAARSRGDLLVFLTQDAIPSSADWLERVVRNFENPRVGAITCRNVPRDDAETLTRVFCRTDPGYGDQRIERTVPEPEVFKAMTPDERRLLYNFNDVASAIRRELWEFHPFPRTMMGEDVLMARGLIHAGYTVVHDAEATVDHSHDYGPEKMQWRGFVDGKFNAEWLDRICIATEEDVKTLAARLVEEDVQCLTEMGFEGTELEKLRVQALELRTALAQGLYEGGLSKIRYPEAAIRDERKLRLLFIDPDENLTTIAQGLGRLGHEIHLLSTEVPILREVVVQWSSERGEAWTEWFLRVPGGSFQLSPSLAGWLAERPIDVCHLSSRTWSDETVEVLHEAGCATLCDWQVNEYEGMVHARDLRRQARAILRITASLELRKHALETYEIDSERFDPQTLAYVENPDGPNRKTRVQSIADAEFRYRGLAALCLREAEEGELSFELTGRDGVTVTGESEPQGADWLLLRPSTVLEFRFQLRMRGLYKIAVEQYVLAAEEDVVLEGSLGFLGGESWRLSAPSGVSEDGSFTREFSKVLEKGNHRLHLATQAGGMLRVCRVSIQPLASESGAQQVPSSDFGELVEQLRVEPGPQVETASLPHAAIVIPHLQDESQLLEALSSINEMDYPKERLKLWIVDNSGELAPSLDGRIDPERIRILPQLKNLGFAAACNLGAKAAEEAELLVFLNDDMVLERDFLRELVSPIVRMECACATARLFDASGKHIDTSGTGTTFHGICVQPGFGEAPADWQDVPRKTLFGCGGAMAIRAGVFDELGGFDEDYFAYYEDLDLGWRLWLAGYEVHYVPSAVGRHHHSSTSKKLPPEQIRRIMVRNSLLTIVKNYDEEHFRRVLPAVLALSSRRAFLKSELDTSAFLIEDGEDGLSGDSARVEVDAMGAADWIAIDDLLSRWDYWMEKRRDVQRRRRRTDAEIQRMFLEPLACVEGDPPYAALQSSLVRLFGLDDVFARR